MLAAASTLLLRAGAVALAVFGAVAFVAPDWASSSFPWKVGPFLAMTIGAWSLGTAAFAWDAGRDLRPERTYPMVIYLLLFGVLELLVVLAFADRLQTTAPLTYPYLIGLVALVAGGVATTAEWRARRAPIVGSGRVATWMKATTLLLGLGVGALAIGTLMAGPDGSTARGEVFPEPLTLFSIRAFCAFLVAITASALSLLAARQVLPFDELARAGLYLVVPITVAALVNLERFDFVGRPGSFVYLAAYVGVGGFLAYRVVQRWRAGAEGVSEQVAPAS